MNLLAFSYGIPQPVLQYTVIFVTPEDIEPVAIMRSNFTMRSITSRTKGVLIVPQGTLSSKAKELIQFLGFCGIYYTI